MKTEEHRREEQSGEVREVERHGKESERAVEEDASVRKGRVRGGKCNGDEGKVGKLVECREEEEI